MMLRLNSLVRPVTFLGHGSFLYVNLIPHFSTLESVLKYGDTFMDIGFKLLNEKQLNELIKDDLVDYRLCANIGIIRYLMQVKKHAPEFIRKNPKRLGYSGLPSLSDKITDRSGSVRAGLREGVTKGHSENAWKGLRAKRAFTNPTVFKTLTGVVNQKGNNLIGRWSPYVRNGSIAIQKRTIYFYHWRSKAYKKGLTFNKDKYSDLSTIKRDIAFSYMWEKRGRPFFAPANQKVQGQFTEIMRGAFGNWVKRFNLER